MKYKYRTKIYERYGLSTKNALTNTSHGAHNTWCSARSPRNQFWLQWYKWWVIGGIMLNHSWLWCWCHSNLLRLLCTLNINTTCAIWTVSYRQPTNLMTLINNATTASYAQVTTTSRIVIIPVIIKMCTLQSFHKSGSSKVVGICPDLPPLSTIMNVFQ